MATHVMTPARRAALRRAQLASAAKRRSRHNVNMHYARGRRNKALQNAGLNPIRRSKIQRQFQADVNKSRVTVLGKKGRSQRNQDSRRIIRAAGRHAVIGTSTAALVAVNFPNSKLVQKADRAAYKAGTRAAGNVRLATRVTKRSPHMAKAFGSGVKTGYSNRRAGQRNMSKVNFNRATAERVGPLALAAGGGGGRRGHNGRKVRGY